MNENEHSNAFSFGNMAILPLLRVSGPILVPLGPNLVLTNNWEYLKLLKMDSVGWKLVG